MKRGVLDFELHPAFGDTAGERHLAVVDEHDQVASGFAEYARERRANVTQDAWVVAVLAPQLEGLGLQSFVDRHVQRLCNASADAQTREDRCGRTLTRYARR
ncbi:MAG TPA: hypothetical protein VGH28_07725 [Polyangiaceae bacterium]